MSVVQQVLRTVVSRDLATQLQALTENITSRGDKSDTVTIQVTARRLTTLTQQVKIQNSLSLKNLNKLSNKSLSFFQIKEISNTVADHEVIIIQDVVLLQ